MGPRWDQGGGAPKPLDPKQARPVAQPRSWTSSGVCRLCCGSSEPRPPPYRVTKVRAGGYRPSAPLLFPSLLFPHILNRGLGPSSQSEGLPTEPSFCWKSLEPEEPSRLLCSLLALPATVAQRLRICSLSYPPAPTVLAKKLPWALQDHLTCRSGAPGTDLQTLLLHKPLVHTPPHYCPSCPPFHPGNRSPPRAPVSAPRSGRSPPLHTWSQVLG